MTLGTVDADRFVRALAEENAQLRALLQKKEPALPPSPPATVTDCSSAGPVSPVEQLPDPMLKVITKATRKPSLDDDDVSPLRTIIELLRVQIASQSSAQDELLSQLGELRSSHASLQAATADVTDELVVMREKSARLAAEVELERAQRERIEAEKTAEADKVLTLRSKVEESRRAIMRLQDEAAARRASESRRGSAVLLGTPLTERRGSIGVPGSAVLEHRRASLFAAGAAVPALPPPSRRASIAVCDTSPAASPGVGLGLDLEGGETRPVTPGPPPASTHHRRAMSVATIALPSKLEGAGGLVDERLAALRGQQRSSSAAAAAGAGDVTDRRRSSLAVLREGGDSSSAPVRRSMGGSLSLGTRPPPARSSISGARRRSSIQGGLPGSQRPSLGTGEDEASVLRAQLEALQRRLAEVESGPRTLQDYVASTPGSTGSVMTPAAPGSRRQSAALAFGSFSFQSRGRNPALLDTPPSPSGGSFSPGGSRRADTDDMGPFGHSSKTSSKESSAEESSGDETVAQAATAPMTPKGAALESLMARCESVEAAVSSPAELKTAEAL